MRTTIRIEDALYREVKARAAREGRTVGAVIEDAIRAHAARGEDPAPPPPLPVFRGTGVLPGVDLADGGALRELMDDADADALR